MIISTQTQPLYHQSQCFWNYFRYRSTVHNLLNSLKKACCIIAVNQRNNNFYEKWLFFLQIFVNSLASMIKAIYQNKLNMCEYCIYMRLKHMHYIFFIGVFSYVIPTMYHSVGIRITIKFLILQVTLSFHTYVCVHLKESIFFCNISVW